MEATSLINESEVESFFQTHDGIHCEKYNCWLRKKECEEYQLDYGKTKRCIGCENNRTINVEDLPQRRTFGHYHVVYKQYKEHKEDLKWFYRAQEFGFDSEKEMLETMKTRWNLTGKSIASLWGESRRKINYRMSKYYLQEMREFDDPSPS